MPVVPDTSQAPHSPLRAYYTCEADRREWVRNLFDRTAGDYERMERLMALGSGSWYRRCALQRAGLQAGMSVVDVGVGTGLVAREAARLVGDGKLVLGVDPSSGMIENAIVPCGGASRVRKCRVDPGARCIGRLPQHGLRPAPYWRSCRGFPGIRPRAEAGCGGCACSRLPRPGGLSRG